MATIFLGLFQFYNRKSTKIYIKLLILILIAPPLITYQSTQINAIDIEIVDFIFYNTKIITIDESNPLAEAIVIKDGLITDIGDTDTILQNYRTNLRNNTMSLEGLTIMPGIVDGHTHLIRSELDGGFQTLYGAQQFALAYGYTTLIEKSVFSWDTHIDPLIDAEQNDLLRLRINIFPDYNLAILDGNNETIVVKLWYQDHDPILDSNRMLRVPGIKIFTDGASGARGIPAMSIPYTPELLAAYESSSLYGDLYFNQSTLNAIVDEIHDRGFSCAFHAMGDRAIDTVLNSIEYALNGSTNDNYRHQIEHNSFMRDDLVSKAVSLNTIHSLRGYYPTYSQDEDESYYTETILDWYANRFSLPDLDVHSFLETDFAWHNYDYDDVSSSRNINPFLHLWGLVTKKAYDETGQLHEPHSWLAEHLLTREQALKVMTLEGAYAVKMEDYIGSLEIGKFADLIVITDNPLTIPEDDLKDIEPMLTMVDGKIEFMWYLHLFPNQNTPSLVIELNSVVLLLINILSFLIWFSSKRNKKY